MFLFPFEDVHRNHESFTINFRSSPVTIDYTSCLAATFVSKKGAKTVRIKTTLVEKKGFTVALVAMADGSKLPVVIIFKEHGRVLGE